MKHTHQSMLLAGLLAVSLGLAGCAGMRGGATSSGTSGATGSSGSSSSTGSTGSSGWDQSGAPAQTGTPTAASSPPNSTVLAIEVIPRASAGSTGATGSTGSSGATAGANSYRVTVRMDDGSSQVITQDTTPDFRSGDRVNVTSGVIQR